MTRNFRPRSSARRRLLIGVAGWLAGCTKTIESQGNEMAMTTNLMTLWQAIDALVKQIPFSKLKVEAVLSARLDEVQRGTYTLFLEGGPSDLADAIRIAKIDLRLGFEPGDPGFLVLNVDGACVGIEQVRTQYSNVEITGMPRGRSFDEKTTHSVQLPWGKLSFGFKERKPECLASIIFNPSKDN